MDIYSYLKNDHSTVKELIDRVCASENIMERRTIYYAIREVLPLHMETEEITFYQTLREKGKRPLQEKTKYLELDHDDIEHFLRLLDITDMKSDNWLILFGQLKYAVERHVGRVEDDIFAEARKVLSQEQSVALATLAETLKLRRGFRKVA